MTSTSDFGFQYGAVTEATAKQIQDLLADKGTVLGTVKIDIYGSEVAAEPMKPGTATHMISTAIYVDSGGHVHAVLIDEVTTSSGTVLEILADVAVN